ncbi:helix-turn-helix domain-containing protein [Pisciglobus halotolerans]|uniref:Protein RodZ, contains Xre-like HTH and DUF4115 domains n=1 Tax=Pisciglobus halotolerans TaxID=745365 RepID=A0A1I3CT23_9LACT|nr:RodZ domain-containing protein [Pisciglobus halotolerans]SFH77488.1 protein RodZ, contains Xre-like HTH and DUF4115 domains [Pisciglobus halotolerans]
MNQVGERLKEARKAKGFTLDDLQQKTKIQKRYLIAIEEGNFDVMPGKFYARAFIKQYADTVGLNGDQLLEEYNDTVPHTHDEEYAEQVSSSQTRTGSRPHNQVSETVQDYLPTILISLLVIAIGVSIYVAVNKTASKNGAEMISSTSESMTISSANGATSSATAEPTASDKNKNDATKQKIEVSSSTGATTVYTVTGQAEGATVVLSAEGGDSWVSIEADGKTLEQGLLSNGDQLEAAVPKEAKSVSAVIGNAPATKVQLNGQQVDYAPEASDKVRQEIKFQFEPAE